MDWRVFSALEDVRDRKKTPLALDFEKISGLRAFDLEFSFFLFRHYSWDECSNLSSSAVCHESLISDCIFYSVGHAGDIPNLVVLCTFEIIGILVAKQRCQQWPGGARAPPPVISLSFPMLLSKDIQLFPLRLES